jgi:hypothetical protein
VCFWGVAKRRFPTGEAANGMPRYSDTCVVFNAAWPLTGPLQVWTVRPTVQSGYLCFREPVNSKAGTARNWRKEVFMMLFCQGLLPTCYFSTSDRTHFDVCRRSTAFNGASNE